jgi:hypothetical protein
MFGARNAIGTKPLRTHRNCAYFMREMCHCSACKEFFGGTDVDKVCVIIDPDEDASYCEYWKVTKPE